MDNDQKPSPDPQQLADLLGIAADEPEDASKNAHDLLEAGLVGTLALDTAVLDNLPAVIGQLDRDVFGGGGKTLGAVLTDPASDLHAIKKIKRYAKGVSTKKTPATEHTVAIAVYYAAIANALLFHNVKISTHPPKTLQDQFRKLAAKPWMTTPLARLFDHAARK